MCEGYELSPASEWVGGSAMSGEEAADWMSRLAANVDTLCFAAVGVSPDHLSGVEWLNKVGREARDGCVGVDIQKADDLKMVRGLMEDPRCL